MHIFKGLILLLSTLFLFGCTENLEQTEDIYHTEKDATHSNQQSLIEETATSEEKGELSYEEINYRDDLEIVENVAVCEEEEVYCFNYDSNIIVKMKMDNVQKEFYKLMMDYKLPEGGVVEDEGSLYELIVYENGYKFYTKNKFLFEAPYHSTEIVEPTEDQYFGMVMMWVELGGGGMEKIEDKEEAQVRLSILNEIKKFAKDEIVLTWVANCSAILQQIVDEENPDKELYLKAMKQLNYLGNVVQIYRYENGNL